MTMPSEERYRELIAALREAAKSFDAAEDDGGRLTFSRSALRAMANYLETDPEVLDGYLLRPIFAIKTAAYDAGQGATVKLLEHAPSRPGKPTETAREVVQGALAFAIELLMASKLGEHRAAVWVATEARQQGVRSEDGGHIIARQIESWRSGISRGKAPALACDTFEGMRSNPINAQSLNGPRAVEKRQTCELLAKLLIKSVATVTSRSAPKQAHRA